MKTSLCAMLATASVLGCLLLSGCSDGQDGDPGPKGPRGHNGTDGTDGNPGKDGNGFNESAAYGNIVVRFSGKLEDGTDVADTLNFRHAPVGVNGFALGSSATIANDAYTFAIHRYYGAVDPSPDLQDNFVRLELDVIPTGDDNLVLPKQCIVHTYMHASPTRLVALQRDFAEILSVEDFKDFVYNPDTGDLSFRLNFKESRQADVGIVALEITLVANLKVFQQIQQQP